MSFPYAPAVIYVASTAVTIWLLYVMVKVAQHVGAWPF